MTCILGLEYDDHVYIGGDSITTNGWNKGIHIEHKVFRLDGFLIGSAGATRMRNLLQHELAIRIQAENESDEHYIVSGLSEAVRECLKGHGFLTIEAGRDTAGMGALVIGYRGRLYWMGSEFDISRFEGGICAVGVGGDFAVAALRALMLTSDKIDPIPMMLQALAISGEYSAGVAPPYYVEVL